MSIEVFFGLWIIIPIFAFMAVALYYDYHRMKQFNVERFKTLFHCTHCGEIYAIKGLLKESECPDCHTENSHLQF